MSVWKNPSLAQVSFRMQFGHRLWYQSRAGDFQREQSLQARAVAAPREAGLKTYLLLVDSRMPSFGFGIATDEVVAEETNYTDWAPFRTALLSKLLSFDPELAEVDATFIGMSTTDRIPLYPRQDKILSLEKYVRLQLEGPGPMGSKPIEEVSWVTDYQMEGPGDRLRIEVRSEQPDENGLEHLKIVTDRRRIGASRVKVEDFLDSAHVDLKNAFESLLTPSTLARLKGDEG